LRRDVTSSKIGRMALGGKSGTDDVVDMLSFDRGNCSLIDSSAGVLVIEQLVV
jgi:hypothetical protein